MKKNVGFLDSFIRVLIGFLLVGLAVFVPGQEWGFIGILVLATGAMGWCPPYAMMGISTCKKCKDSA